MKSCELCNGVARMYCESDDASLCWNCDEKVHCANFLVAKHCRSLLCQICQSPTTWKASGPKLGPTVSICESCFSLRRGRKSEIYCHPEESHTGNYLSDDDYLDGHSDDQEEEDEEEDDDDDDDEGENQVVPWSVTSATLPEASSSSSDDVSSRLSRGSSVLKRMRENSADLDSDDDQTVCSSCHIGYGKLSNSEGNPMASNRPLKQARRGSEVEDDGEEEEEDDGHQNDQEGEEESGSRATIHSLKRLQTKMVIRRENESQTILGICRLGRRHSIN